MSRFLRRASGEDRLLRIDKAVIAKDAHYDGKWVICTSDDTLTTADLAIAYKQLSQVERGWRDRMHLVTVQTTDGRIAQRTATTAGQHKILAALDIREPGLIIDYQLPADA